MNPERHSNLKAQAIAIDAHGQLGFQKQSQDLIDRIRSMAMMLLLPSNPELFGIVSAALLKDRLGTQDAILHASSISKTAKSQIMVTQSPVAKSPLGIKPVAKKIDFLANKSPEQIRERANKALPSLTAMRPTHTRTKNSNGKNDRNIQFRPINPDAPKPIIFKKDSAPNGSASYMSEQAIREQKRKKARRLGNE